VTRSRDRDRQAQAALKQVQARIRVIMMSRIMMALQSNPAALQLFVVAGNGATAAGGGPTLRPNLKAASYILRVAGALLELECESATGNTAVTGGGGPG
jgi:hypothetical protein